MPLAASGVRRDATEVAHHSHGSRESIERPQNEEAKRDQCDEENDKRAWTGLRSRDCAAHLSALGA